ncbi:RNA polymerase sigma factor [Dysgonomonas sp. HDW5B]|uniref:RNA polymerase sigma factor n=1 Tax=Dysgonomonas sp. HDW5B TaxID=2714927 RepID=UPI00140C6160|nr:RNA polymerase sigma factor [Dysgonomonas sp. HDW5B]QIK53941.1 RNA polymerase sigma factor [Dysgonomonas sp. HDW5B]
MDAITFKEKYIPYHQKLYRVAYRLLEDACDAEDVVQEAYIKLWNKRDELTQVENSEAYCVILLRNLCLDFLRAKKKHLFQSTEDTVISDNLVLSDEIETVDEIKHIETIIDLLPEQQRKIIKLRHFDDYSNEEIEEIMGLTSVNVRVLMSRARKKVKELFNSYNYGY